MFDESWANATDADIVDAIGDAARAEAAAAARRLAAIAELVSRHAKGSTAHAHWSCDNWDAIAAQVAAIHNISHTMASGQMYFAVALRDRLPGVAVLFAQGLIDARLASTIVWRTNLIKDPEVLRRVDATLANDAQRFGPLSATKTAEAIDDIVDHYDPAALRRTRISARGREVVVAPPDDDSGTAHLWGSLLATDAAVLDRKLTAMAHHVCDNDPRTLAQRRADALGTLGADGNQLACRCGTPNCPAALETDPRAAAVLIHVIAEPATMNAKPDPHTNGEPAPRPITPQTTLREAAAPDPEPSAIWLPSAHILGGGTVPAPLLADLIAAGAKVTQVNPLIDTTPEPGYRPSAALARFVRCRDMTCRFPGCDCPAEFCDIDHSIPYPRGLTHPSNLKCLCRKHHLLKTFWTGWRDKQCPDGTIVWTSPTGHTYSTRPGSRLLFPTLCLSTGELPTAQVAEPPSALRGIMMPARRRTRQQDRARRIDAERALNADRVAERNQPPPF